MTIGNCLCEFEPGIGKLRGCREARCGSGADTWGMPFSSLRSTVARGDGRSGGIDASATACRLGKTYLREASSSLSPRLPSSTLSSSVCVRVSSRCLSTTMVSLRAALSSASIVVALFARAALADNPISSSFAYGSTKVRGVNLGGWLVLEVSISRPAPTHQIRTPESARRQCGVAQRLDVTRRVIS